MQKAKYSKAKLALCFCMVRTLSGGRCRLRRAWHAKHADAEVSQYLRNDRFSKILRSETHFLYTPTLNSILSGTRSFESPVQYIVYLVQYIVYLNIANNSILSLQYSYLKMPSVPNYNNTIAKLLRNSVYRRFSRKPISIILSGISSIKKLSRFHPNRMNKICADLHFNQKCSKGVIMDSNKQTHLIISKIYFS